MTFFRDSKIQTYKKMWEFMENKKPSVFVKNYKEGKEKVKKVIKILVPPYSHSVYFLYLIIGELCIPHGVNGAGLRGPEGL